jgi:hypothetical protein
MLSLKELKKIRKKALIIAAHPDDESLFMGGTIAEFKEWSWTVLCVTDCDGRYNGRRRQELLKACRTYNRNGSHIKPLTLGIVKKRSSLLKSEVSERIRNFIDEFGPFDIVFTHGDKGDYGHKTHRLIHDVVNKLGLPKVYNFHVTLCKETSSISPVAKSPKNMQVIGLSSKSRRIKKQAVNIYLKGSQKTNLLRLKRLVAYALNTKAELFQRGN